MSRRILQALLGIMAAVAGVAGLKGVTWGTREMLRSGPVPANVDSEYRFYAAWYATFGALLLPAVREPAGHAVLVRAGAAGYIIAATGRLIAWRKGGRPDPVQIFLLCLEVALPFIIVPWQARVRARASGDTSGSSARTS